MSELEEKSCCYVHETHSIGCSDGELYLSHEGGTIVFNVTSLFTDLPTIVSMVVKEQKKEQERTLNSLKQETNEII
jgi:hypothetical protein|tara:strand:+ start:358 stop:585 length:228 start_codon:yes stop_codon:yes gene_type:complete